MIKRTANQTFHDIFGHFKVYFDCRQKYFLGINRNTGINNFTIISLNFLNIKCLLKKQK